MDDIQNKKHLNIAMIGHKRIPSRDGGVEVVVGELATRLSAMGHHVTCFNRMGRYLGDEPDAGQGMKEYQGVRLRYMPTLRQKGFAAFSASFFGAFFCAFGNYDVVHFHAEGPSAMCWLPKLFGKRVIVTIHGLDHQRAKWGWFARKFIHVGEMAAARWADEIIVLSRGMQEYFLKEYGRETRFIPNGVTRPEHCEADIIRSQWNLEKDSYILFLGRLVPEKGIQYLIEAFRRTRTDKKLVIAGGISDTGRFLSELQKMAADDSRIIFTGFVQDKTLAELYSNAYIYVLPSDLEGMPLSLLEAMSYGNCCLVSDISECAEVVEDRAFLFRKGDAADLHSQLQLLCDHPEMVESCRNGTADFICGKYRWEEVINQTLGLYYGFESIRTQQLNCPAAKKRILFIVEAMGGGVFTYVVDLSNELVDLYDVYVAYAVRIQTPDDYSEYFDKRVHLIHVQHFRRSINPFTDVRALFEIRKIAAEVQPDIIHLHSSKAGALGRIAFNGKKVPLFYTPHGYSFLMENHGPIRRRFYRSVEMFCGRRNCTTISCSRGEHRETLRLNKRAYYVNNGINTAELDSLLEGMPSSSPSAKKEHPYTVYTLGRICYQKNPSMFNAVAQQMPELRFVWIGDGDMRKELTASNIEITGWLRREDAVKEASGCDLFLLTSLWEGLPMSLLESMYIRKLCVVSNVIGNRDVIVNEVNGLIFDTVDECAAAIRKGIQPGYADSMIRQAHQDILENYNNQKMSESYSRIYQAELKRRVSGRN